MTGIICGATYVDVCGLVRMCLHGGVVVPGWDQAVKGPVVDGVCDLGLPVGLGVLIIITWCVVLVLLFTTLLLLQRNLRLEGTK